MRSPHWTAPPCCGRSWRRKPEVARKVYPAIRRVFDRARVILRDGHSIEISRNPADWSDLKAQGFETPARLTRGRQSWLPYAQMPEFMADLRSRDALAARALDFLILTGLRTDADLKTTWVQLDLEADVFFEGEVEDRPITNVSRTFFVLKRLYKPRLEQIT